MTIKQMKRCKSGETSDLTIRYRMLRFGFQHATTFLDSLARLRYVTGLIRGTSKDVSDVDPSSQV